MRAYVATSGAIFALLVVAHLLRAFEEGMHLAREGWFVVTTIAAAMLCVWALRLLRPSVRP